MSGAGGVRPDPPTTADDLEPNAREVLDDKAFGYVAGGVEHVIRSFLAEMGLTLGFAGHRSFADLDRNAVRQARAGTAWTVLGHARRDTLRYHPQACTGEWPNGKAPDSGSGD